MTDWQYNPCLLHVAGKNSTGSYVEQHLCAIFETHPLWTTFLITEFPPTEFPPPLEMRHLTMAAGIQHLYAMGKTAQQRQKHLLSTMMHNTMSFGKYNRRSHYV